MLGWALNLGFAGSGVTIIPGNDDVWQPFPRGYQWDPESRGSMWSVAARGYEWDPDPNNSKIEP